jgi:hypothetical protein
MYVPNFARFDIPAPIDQGHLWQMMEHTEHPQTKRKLGQIERTDLLLDEFQNNYHPFHSRRRHCYRRHYQMLQIGFHLPSLHL